MDVHTVIMTVTYQFVSSYMTDYHPPGVKITAHT